MYFADPEQRKANKSLQTSYMKAPSLSAPTVKVGVDELDGAFEGLAALKMITILSFLSQSAPI